MSAGSNPDSDLSLPPSLPPSLSPSGGTQAFRIAAALRSLTVTARKGPGGGGGAVVGCYQYNRLG
jgi:hypothetical protein